MKKLQTTLTIILILASSLLWAVKPAQAMKRESRTPDLIIQPGDLAEALDMSLAIGDGRRINWEAVGF